MHFLRETYMAPIKLDEHYSDKLKCTLPVRNGVCDFDIYDGDGQLQTFETFQQHADSCELVLIIDLDRVWFSPGGRFGVTPIVRCIVYFPSADGPGAYRPPSFVPIADEQSGVRSMGNRLEGVAPKDDGRKRVRLQGADDDDDDAKHTAKDTAKDAAKDAGKDGKGAFAFM